MGALRHYSFPLVLLVAVAGCKKKDPAKEAADHDDKICDEELAGPKHAEAREWCGASQDTHLGFKVGRDQMLEITEDFYRAGADMVYVVGISELNGGQIAAELAVILPADPAKRAAVFDAEKKTFGEDPEFKGTPDVGQRCLLVGLD
jgi:hypothetical protein